MARHQLFTVFLVLISVNAITGENCKQWRRQDCRNKHLCISRQDECQAACYWVEEDGDRRAESCWEYCEDNSLGCSHFCPNYQKCIPQNNSDDVQKGSDDTGGNFPDFSKFENEVAQSKSHKPSLVPQCIQWGKMDCQNTELCESRHDECQAACYWVEEDGDRRAESCWEYCEDNSLGCSHYCPNYRKCIPQDSSDDVEEGSDDTGGNFPDFSKFDNEVAQSKSHKPSLIPQCIQWEKMDCQNTELCESRHDECQAACYWVEHDDKRRAESCQEYCRDNSSGCRLKCPDFKKCLAENDKLADKHKANLVKEIDRLHSLLAVFTPVAFVAGVLVALLCGWLRKRWTYRSQNTSPESGFSTATTSASSSMTDIQENHKLVNEKETG